MTGLNDALPNLHSLASVSTEVLRAELVKRREEDNGDLGKPQCGSGSSLVGYNTSLHVGALVLILLLSTLACSFPIIARRFPKLPIPHRFLFLSRHFGTGVLIATAFVHLLPTAFTSLTDPCLSSFWTEGYPAMAGLIAMVSVLAVVGIEMFFAIRGAGHIHAAEYDSLDSAKENERDSGMAALPRSRPASVKSSLRLFRASSYGYEEPGWDEVPSNGITVVKGPPTSTVDDPEQGLLSDADSDLDIDDHDPVVQSRPSRIRRSNSDETPFVNGSSTTNLNTPQGNLELPNGHHQTHQNSSTVSLSQQKAHEEQKLLLQCLLLEAGILFHSIFIGMALSVATGPPFVVLLIAISFHQTFEGLALGSRISAITSFGPRSPKPWLMALAYGTTTPIGQAIGLAVHNLYDPASETGLLMVGVMNAISSGLLLFAGLVELLAEDFLSDQSYEVLQGSKRLQACGSVVAGSLLMALVGAWA